MSVKDYTKEIYYSGKYCDEEHEYRHVVLPKELVKLVPKNHLMSEQEWRSIGVQQSQGWVHYMAHQPGIGIYRDFGKAHDVKQPQETR